MFFKHEIKMFCNTYIRNITTYDFKPLATLNPMVALLTASTGCTNCLDLQYEVCLKFKVWVQNVRKLEMRQKLCETVLKISLVLTAKVE